VTIAIEPIETAVLEDWTDWKWQQRHAVRSAKQVAEIFPGLSQHVLDRLDRDSLTRRFQATRYYLNLVERTADGLSPVDDDPLWLQVLPAISGDEEPASYAYDGETENWELAEEMVTPIAQRKYPDRVIVRLANVCHSYCQFCYEALRTLEPESDKATFRTSLWDDTVRFVRETPAIDEVILSGGEPLMHSDSRLDGVLGDLRSIDRPITIRLHTRALTFNPFRVTPELVEILAKHRVNSIGLHVTSARELTPEFADGVSRLRSAVPILFANIPLLEGVNATAADIRELSMGLYRLGVARGYLYHFMPHSPAAERFRTSVQAGVEIIRQLKRRTPNLAVPEYVLPHSTGKHSMPLLAQGETPPTRGVNDAGDHVVRYTNWDGELVDYPDPPIGHR
jgi:lysine 2,3-aminomutase